MDSLAPAEVYVLPPSDKSLNVAQPQAVFQSTQWSVVLRAGDQPSEEARSALDALCLTYWYPLYAYVRRQGHSQHDASDLTQGFFAQLIETRGISSVHPDKGRFRAFLLASLKNFIRNDWRRKNAVRRGGGTRQLSIDERDFERQYQQRLGHESSPEQQFERDWVESLLRRVLGQVRADYEAAGRGDLFEVLHHYLIADGEPLPQSEIAAQLGLSISAVKMSVHRLRKQYAKRLREEVAATLASPADIDDELGWLISAMRR